jgi:hypothetical protein
MREPPARRIAEMTQDEIGVYIDGDRLQIVVYDQQGDGVLDIPRHMAKRLGGVLIELASDPPATLDES